MAPPDTYQVDEEITFTIRDKEEADESYSSVNKEHNASDCSVSDGNRDEIETPRGG